MCDHRQLKVPIMHDTPPRLFLRKKEGARDIYSDGVLFSVEGEKKYDCQYGGHYFKQKKGTCNSKTPQSNTQQSTQAKGTCI